MKLLCFACLWSFALFSFLFAGEPNFIKVSANLQDAAKSPWSPYLEKVLNAWNEFGFSPTDFAKNSGKAALTRLQLEVLGATHTQVAQENETKHFGRCSRGSSSLNKCDDLELSSKMDGVNSGVGVRTADEGVKVVAEVNLEEPALFDDDDESVEEVEQVGQGDSVPSDSEAEEEEADEGDSSGVSEVEEEDEEFDDIFKGDGVEEFSNSIGGYIHLDEVGEGDKLFYWLFPARNESEDKRTPLILWLTGGPGCASSMAAIAENGPFGVDSSLTLHRNEFSWSELGHLLFVDQPLGTGFSVAKRNKDIPRNEHTVAEDMIIFLQKFVEKYPFTRDTDFYVTGESYAGHYIPAISNALVNAAAGSVPLNFLGMAIGNGWIEPMLQYPAYASFGYMEHLINGDAFAKLNAGYLACVAAIEAGALDIAWNVCNVLTSIVIGSKNPYDLREECKYPPLCYDFSQVSKFLNHPAVQKHLNVDMNWQECSDTVYAAMEVDWLHGLDSDIANVLRHGKKVLMYHGDQDIICNWLGGLSCAADVLHSQDSNFNKGVEMLSPWYVRDEEAGKFFTSGNFSFLKVYGAGHMVPMDKPEQALQLLKDFLVEQS